MHRIGARLGAWGLLNLPYRPPSRGEGSSFASFVANALQVSRTVRHGPPTLKYHYWTPFPRPQIQAFAIGSTSLFVTPGPPLVGRRRSSLFQRPFLPDAGANVSPLNVLPRTDAGRNVNCRQRIWGIYSSQNVAAPLAPCHPMNSAGRRQWLLPRPRDRLPASLSASSFAAPF